MNKTVAGVGIRLKLYELRAVTEPVQVTAGSVSVYLQKWQNGQPIGRRQYLFSAQVGEIIWSGSSESDYQFWVEAETEAELSTLGDTLPLEAVDKWIHNLGTYLASFNPPPVITLYCDQEEHFTLLKGQKLRPQKGLVRLVQVSKGEVKWQGDLAFVLLPGSGWLPLGEGMWIEAVAPNNLVKVEVEVTSLDRLRPAEVRRSLDYLLAYFWRYVAHQGELQAQAELARLQARAQLNQQLLEKANAELVAILEPKETEAVQEGSPLLVVMGAVGRAMGIKISPPASSENLKRVKELEAIARASRVRVRQVLLRDKWWLEDAGPLVGFVLPDRTPVALLRDKGYYELLDPTDLKRQVVDSRVNARLDSQAYMLYRPLPQKLRSGLDLLKFGFRGQIKDIILIVVLGITITLLGMVTPQATGLLIDSAIPDADRGLLLQIGLAPIAATFGSAIFQWSRGMIQMRVETLADSVTQAAVWDKLLTLGIPFFRRYATGDLENRVSAIGEIRKRLGGNTIETLFTSFFSLLNLGLLFYYSPPLALIALLIAVVLVIFATVTGVIILRNERPLQELRANIFGTVVQLINGITKLKIAGAEERAFKYWTEQYSRQQRLVLQQQSLQDLIQLFTAILPILSSGLIFTVAVLLLSKGGETPSLTTGKFLAFNTAFGTFLDGAAQLSNTLTDVLDVVTLWERGYPIISTSPELPPNATDPGVLRGQIQASHLCFRYRPDGPLILDDVSFYAEPGEFIAFVGPSGSGKSTTLRLLLGFEQPESGSIFYDGQELSGLDIYAVRRQIGTVLQNGRIMSASIFENIAAGAVITMEEAWQAVRMAGMENDIKQMPMGLHTIISEGGTNLSGGQRQRLLIARALVLKPSIIYFDEATSALDNRTQSIISKSLDELQVTRIVIAHRLSTIRHADRIYVMEAGRIVQVGNFEQLQSEPGLFARLIARQLA
ncbi:MAG: NHLP bacteriocin export ABC transporter permease/ATPase subunit [Pseudanabaenaceae cyanobacterium SKYGB_i_bin29]|nr:NHLP bacteriocin export ABC transporter permease/ATPase subunit [Pseudanabaenaceae cyanobacterium SKYG29]MDW8421843.1 NHLP bacteriocin export ABC transporter permease/ATPase subunit [Pseudanabaenaceae cyanobacterium SKYGB_i_bin29]